MKIYLMGLLLLLTGCSGTMDEDEAVQNVRDNIPIEKTDEDIKEAMRNACDLFDDLGVPLVAASMAAQYSQDQLEALLINAAAAYCPEYSDKVQEVGG